MAAKAAEGIEAMSCARPMETNGHKDSTSAKDENEDSDEDEDKDEEGANVEAGAPGGNCALVLRRDPS